MLSTSELISMKSIAPFRNPRLFKEFLPIGYNLTTLDSVAKKNEVIEIKIILGTLITLYDDFADRPTHLILDYLSCSIEFLLKKQIFTRLS